MGRDKFLYLLRRHHLILPPRKPKHTTNSNHIYFKYPNLIKGLPITYVNQVWVCDITYIYTGEGFCYLHLVTDAFSRMIIGFILAQPWKPNTLSKLWNKRLLLPEEGTCAEPSTTRTEVSNMRVMSIQWY